MKIFCYVDETGQDTRGQLFVVSVVVAAQDREELRAWCENLEQETGKRWLKWVDAAHARRMAYIQRVLQSPIWRGRLRFATYENSSDYVTLTTRAISKALQQLAYSEATVLIDAFPRSAERNLGLQLRRQGLRTKKVRGIRKEENDALMRLADAVCGFVRLARQGSPDLQNLYQQALNHQTLIEL